MFVILSRFDAVYYHLYDANKYQLEDYSFLWDYMRELYQIPTFRESTNFEAIKQGTYLGKHGAALMRRPIVPAGPTFEKLDLPIERTYLK